MKQITTLWSYLLTLLVAVTMSTAQETSSLRALRSDASASLRAGETLSGFGYADRFAKSSFLGTGKTGIYLSCYIKLPDVGVNSIKKISFPASKADENAYILILSEDGKTTLYNQACSIVNGNNEITLSTPFATETGKRYTVGFATKATGSGENDPFVIPFDLGDDIEGARFVGLGSDPFPTEQSTAESFSFFKVEGKGAACIFVTLENESKLQNMGYLLSSSGSFELVKKGANIPTTFNLRNIGLNDITSIEITYQFGTGATKTISHTPTAALATGKTEKYTIDIPAEGEGLGTVHFSISKVNGQENIFAEHRIDLPFQIGDNDAIDRETVILERFTTEKCPNCPRADPFVKALIEKLTESGLRVSYIMHHAGYYTDFLTLPESEKLLPYFFSSEGSFAPALSVNRTFMPKDDALVNLPAAFDPIEWTDKMKNKKQGVKIEKIDQTVADGKLKVVVSGVALKGAFDSEDLYLTVIVTEDNVASKHQAGASSSYKHEAVPRLFLTKAFGDKVTPSADGTFSLTLEGTLKSDWVSSLCKVVAIVHPSVSNSNKNSRSVHTAETTALGSNLANEKMVPAQAPIVSAEDGYLNILGHVDAFELYDMSGALVTTSVGTRLEPGVYAIRIFSNLRVYTAKVVVR